MFSAVLLASLLAAEPGANLKRVADEARAARPVGKAKAVARRGGGFRAFRGAGLAGRTFAVNRFAFRRHHAGYGFGRFAFGGYGAGATYAGGYGVAAAAPCETAAYVAPAVAAYAAAPVYAAPVYAAGCGCGGASAAFGYAPAYGYGYGFRRFGFGHQGHHR